MTTTEGLPDIVILRISQVRTMNFENLLNRSCHCYKKQPFKLKLKSWKSYHECKSKLPVHPSTPPYCHKSQNVVTREGKKEKRPNFPTMIRSHEASIDISFDKEGYTSPDTLNATISITNHKLIKLKSLVVEILGFEEISYHKHPLMREIFFSPEPGFETDIFYRNTITLLRRDESPWTLPPGQHVFPVVCNLPQGLPASYRVAWSRHLYGIIGYKFTVRTQPTDLFLAKVANLLTKGDHGWPNKRKFFCLVDRDEDSYEEQVEKPQQPTLFQKKKRVQH